MAESASGEDKSRRLEEKLQLQAVAGIYHSRKVAKQRKNESIHGLLNQVIGEYRSKGFDFITRQRLSYHINKLEGKGNSTESSPNDVPREVMRDDGDSLSALTGISGTSSQVTSPVGVATGRIGRPTKEQKQKEEVESRKRKPPW